MGIPVNKYQDKWASLLNRWKSLACQRSNDIEDIPRILIPLTGGLRVIAFLCSVAAVGIGQGRHLGVGFRSHVSRPRSRGLDSGYFQEAPTKSIMSVLHIR